MAYTTKSLRWYQYVSSLTSEPIPDTVAKVFNGATVWVRFIDPKESRCGSIGILKRWSDPKQIPWTHSSKIWKANEISHWEDLEVDFPGLKASPIKIAAHKMEGKLELLLGYTGPAVRQNNKVEKPKPVTATVDMFGHDTKIGDLIAFTHYGNLKFGNILKIHQSGAMQIKTMPDNYEVRASAGFPFAVIHKNFSQSLMLVKLTHTG